MALENELITYHGWGFDHTCWDPWIDILPPELNIATFDRGYFGTDISPVFSTNVEKEVIFAHSLGLHLCPEEQFKKARLLVIFNGFINFHPQAAQFRRRSRLILQNMVKKFKEEPKIVLKDFLRNTFHPVEKDFSDLHIENMNRAKLLNDLKLLSKSIVEEGDLKKIDEICILHGSDDSIVPKAKGRELHNKLAGNTTYFEVKEAGHALPFTHYEKCWSIIKPRIDELIEIKT